MPSNPKRDPNRSLLELLIL